MKHALQTRGKSGPVRPRVVWIGLALALAGMVALAVGITADSWAWTWCGVGALTVGVVTGVRGGALYDAVSVLSVKRELRQAARGRSHEGVSAGEMVQRRKARSRAVKAAVTTNALLERSGQTHTTSLARVAGWTLFLTMAAAVLTQWAWVAHTAIGRNTSGRDDVLLVIVGLCGIRLGVVPGRHRIAGSLVTVAGVCLLLSAAFAPHDGMGAIAAELVVGTAALASGVVAYLAPASPRAEADQGQDAA